MEEASDRLRFHRTRLGDFTITVLSDGSTSRQVDQIMSRPSDVRALLASCHCALPVNLSINSFLIDNGSQLLLVDTGAGELFGTDAGRLVSSLRAAGYEPEDIKIILLTHIHADHSGGLSVGGLPVFPNAQVYVDKRDPALWLSESEEAQAAEGRKRTFQQSRATVGRYAAEGRLCTFDGTAPAGAETAGELFTGVRPVSAYGHTPGHTAYLVESKGERLLIWGDTVHVAEVQFAEPGITITYDVDSAAAASSRSRLLAQAAAEGYLIGGAHLPFPGLGHVQRDGKSYKWVPINPSRLEGTPNSQTVKQ